MTAIPDRLDETVVIVGGELGADSEKSRETGGLGKIPPVVIDAILQAGIAFDVCAGLALEHYRTAIWEDQSIPD
ncbi:hypothetical protein ATE72_08720 [Sphingopyxis sp. HXXIV]|nr:hypothetical protein ATE72_08720 [Sphingopyxis sp. HXXIV]